MGIFDQIKKNVKKGAKAIKDYQDAEPERIREELKKEKAKLKLDEQKAEIEKIKKKREKLKNKSPKSLF